MACEDGDPLQFKVFDILEPGHRLLGFFFHPNRGVLVEFQQLLIIRALGLEPCYVLHMLITIALDADQRALLHQEVVAELWVEAIEDQVSEEDELIDITGFYISEHCFQCPKIPMNISKYSNSHLIPPVICMFVLYHTQSPN